MSHHHAIQSSVYSVLKFSFAHQVILYSGKSVSIHVWYECYLVGYWCGMNVIWLVVVADLGDFVVNML